MIHVVGFLFTSDMREVVLLEKRRPDYQVGKLNGVGGKSSREDCPVPAHLMIDKTRKEIGDIDVKASWKQFVILAQQDYMLYCYYAVTRRKAIVESINGCKHDEKANLWTVNSMKKDACVAHVLWLIQLARAFEDGLFTGADNVLYVK